MGMIVGPALSGCGGDWMSKAGKRFRATLGTPWVLALLQHPVTEALLFWVLWWKGVLYFYFYFTDDEMRHREVKMFVKKQSCGLILMLNPHCSWLVLLVPLHQSSWDFHPRCLVRSCTRTNTEQNHGQGISIRGLSAQFLVIGSLQPPLPGTLLPH